jgi:hypothetical protein
VSKTRSSARGGLSALLTVLAVTAALVVPLAGAAQAAVPTKLDAPGEDEDVAFGKRAQVTAILKDASGEVVVDSAFNIDFEYTGPNDPDGGFSPRTPDDTCDIGPGFPSSTKCTEKYGLQAGVQQTPGEGTVYVWVDTNGDADDSDLDAGEAPGVQDGDFTDVVLRTFFDPVADTLNCAEKSTAEDGSSVNVQCSISPASEGVVISYENLGGASDPDGPPGTPMADEWPACTTGVAGKCTVTIGQLGGDTGPAKVCFWVDEENDGSYHPTRLPSWDGGACDDEAINGPENDNATDVVTIGWGARADVTISTPAKTKSWGSRFTISGALGSTDPGCEDGVEVKIRRDAAGGAVRWAFWRKDTTGANGGYSVSGTAKGTASYRAEVADKGACLGDLSGSKKLRVAKKVSIAASDASGRGGQIVRISGAVQPCRGHAGDKVALLKRKGGSFRRVDTAKTNASCAAVFYRKVAKSAVFRLRSAKTEPGLEAGVSRALTVQA